MLKAGVEIPATRGLDLLPDIRKWGDVLVKRVEKRLKEFFPLNEGESVIAYIWANAVPCPRTGRLVPLLRDKWLRKAPGKEAAVRMVTSAEGIELQGATLRGHSGARGRAKLRRQHRDNGARQGGLSIRQPCHRWRLHQGGRSKRRYGPTALRRGSPKAIR